jgi:hypothetical protein
MAHIHHHAKHFVFFSFFLFHTMLAYVAYIVGSFLDEKENKKENKNAFSSPPCNVFVRRFCK